MSFGESKDINSILVVCWANFCRSPVAEFILKHKTDNALKISSAGIMPMSLPNFDKRSQYFLEKNNIQFGLHLPKKVSNKLIDEHDVVLAFDPIILRELNKNFPKQRSKYKIFNYINKSLFVSDPFKYNDEQYDLVMNNIMALSDLILKDINEI